MVFRARLPFVSLAVAAICSISTAFRNATERIGDCLDRLAAFGLAWLGVTPGSLIWQAGDPRLMFDDFGQANDPALLQSLRHEAGVPRRAAPRNG